jgi:pSer/pThr/pTyr-binding forkhead associated (FHA) protein
LQNAGQLRLARRLGSGKFQYRTVAELILTLRERELARFPIATLRTTIGRDPSCDVVIDNAGISRLHGTIEVVGDSFVLRDADSQNGMTLNGEPCREARLVDGDTIGLNKFLLRFSNAELVVPANLVPEPAQPERPKDVQRTVHLGAAAAQALAERAKEQIARQRAERATRGDQSLAPQQSPVKLPALTALREEEAEAPRSNLVLLLSCLVMSIALAASVVTFLR